MVRRDWSSSSNVVTSSSSSTSCSCSSSILVRLGLVLVLVAVLDWVSGILVSLAGLVSANTPHPREGLEGGVGEVLRRDSSYERLDSAWE